jgi:deazaflavin-dependent oxidoreductase (nitroreductase family)
MPDQELPREQELTPVTAGLDLSLFGDEHVRQYEETGGEVGYFWNGAPCLVLTTTGRTSGETRKIPIIFGRDGDDVVLIGSQGGAPTHPNWYLNLQVDPHGSVQVRGDRWEVVASTAEGAERERLWKLMTDIWPAYDTYQSRTDRVIPVVRLERAPT